MMALAGQAELVSEFYLETNLSGLRCRHCWSQSHLFWRDRVNSQMTMGKYWFCSYLVAAQWLLLLVRVLAVAWLSSAYLMRLWTLFQAFGASGVFCANRVSVARLAASASARPNDWRVRSLQRVLTGLLSVLSQSAVARAAILAFSSRNASCSLAS